MLTLFCFVLLDGVVGLIQGDIYLGLDLNAGDYVAIKIESIESQDPQLCHEARVYELVQGGKGIA